PDAVRVPAAPAALERDHHDRRDLPRHLADPLHRQLLLVAVRGPEGPDESVELDHARVDGAVAAAAHELGPDAADRVPRAVRIQCPGCERGLLAADPADPCAGDGTTTLTAVPWRIASLSRPSPRRSS